ncbi:MAG: hypothetical protein KTR31_23005 [Myxococcales bacterium]|nr:hypothetical protein [Myxococcales bacterium]
MSVFVPVFAFLFLLAVKGFLLQTSVALTGDPAPRYGAALITAVWASFLSGFGATAWSWTFGLVLGFFSATLATALTLLVGVAIMGAVFRSRLGLSGGHAFVVALLYKAMWWGLITLIGKVLLVMPGAALHF